MACLSLAVLKTVLQHATADWCMLIAGHAKPAGAAESQDGCHSG